MKIAYCFAALLMTLTVGIDRAAAAPKNEADFLSPHIGQCVALITTSELSIPGILQAVNENSVELDVTGFPAVVYLAQVMVAVADPTGSSGACVESEGAAKMLQSIGLAEPTAEAR